MQIDRGRRRIARTTVLSLLVGLGASATLSASAYEPGLGAAPDRPTVSAEVLARHRLHSGARIRTTARWSGAVRTGDRAAVNAAYWNHYAPTLDVPIGYTGDDERCVAGGISGEAHRATEGAVNFARSLSGLAPVSFDPELDGRSQATALMMSANDSLSHHPDTSWRCYSRVGADNAGRSNLALSYPEITAGGAIDLYLEDDHANNTAVGHRRWLLNPFITRMGVGATDKAQSLTIIGPTSSSRPNPAWVSWPTAGYFPAPLEPKGRWSLSAGDRALSFRRATVRVQRNGTALRVRKQAVQNGFAQPTIVWEMPDAAARSGTFKVTVSGITRAKSRKKYTRTYEVRMFTPSR